MTDFNPSCSINEATCSAPGGKIVRGWCMFHYCRWRDHGNPRWVRAAKATECRLADATCSGKRITNGLCPAHYKAERRAARSAEGLRCIVEGCPDPVDYPTLGLCTAHYLRDRRHGNRSGGGPRRGGPAGFIRSALEYESDECLLWPFGTSDAGYGRLSWEGKVVYAHRLILTLTAGPPPDPEMMACHLAVACHKTSCCNKRHLRWDYQLGNMSDLVADDTHIRGERHPHAILNRGEVLAIRVDPRPDPVIALEYGVSVGCIQAIQARRTWAWLSDDPDADEAAA